jgi:hypothetical protein
MVHGGLNGGDYTIWLGVGGGVGPGVSMPLKGLLFVAEAVLAAIMMIIETTNSIMAANFAA